MCSRFYSYTQVNRAIRLGDFFFLYFRVSIFLDCLRASSHLQNKKLESDE